MHTGQCLKTIDRLRDARIVVNRETTPVVWKSHPLHFASYGNSHLTSPAFHCKPLKKDVVLTLPLAKNTQNNSHSDK